jgi:hypothetical protein
LWALIPLVTVILQFFIWSEDPQMFTLPSTIHPAYEWVEEETGKWTSVLFPKVVTALEPYYYSQHDPTVTKARGCCLYSSVVMRRGLWAGGARLPRPMAYLASCSAFSPATHPHGMPGSLGQSVKLTSLWTPHPNTAVWLDQPDPSDLSWCSWISKDQVWIMIMIMMNIFSSTPWLSSRL